MAPSFADGLYPFAGAKIGIFSKSAKFFVKNVKFLFFSVLCARISIKKRTFVNCADDYIMRKCKIYNNRVWLGYF